MSGTCKTPRNGVLGAGKPGQADTSNIPLLLLLGRLCPVPRWQPTAQLLRPLGMALGCRLCFSACTEPSVPSRAPPRGRENHLIGRQTLGACQKLKGSDRASQRRQEQGGNVSWKRKEHCLQRPGWVHLTPEGVGAAGPACPAQGDRQPGARAARARGPTESSSYHLWTPVTYTQSDCV